MDEEDIYTASLEAFSRILNADIVAGDFARKAGLEENLEGVRKCSEEFEKLLTPESKGAFNLIICYAYKPFMKIPGISRTCKVQAKYFLNRAKSFGIEIPK